MSLVEYPHGQDVLPAPAGMSLALSLFRALECSAPRASGDEPRASTGVHFPVLCSPRQRG